MIYFRWQVDVLLEAKDEQIERLQKALTKETERADNAVDNLLRMAGSSGIKPMKIEERGPAKDVLAELNAEISQIGLMPADEEPKKEANG